MQKLIISLICCLLPTLALADVLKPRDDAPDRYVVVKGDTLWDISAKFFTDPWKWPEIWGLNKEAIPNPHWIYPGDIVVLDRRAKTLKVLPPEVPTTPPGPGVTPVPPPERVPEKLPPEVTPSVEIGREGAERLRPKIRVVEGDHEAIPGIPLRDIEPFLNRPLIVGKRELDKGPVIVSGYEFRTLLSNDDIAYVKRLPNDQGLAWQVYRPGKPLTDVGSNKVLGYEARYLGDARVEKFGDVATVRIFGSKEEIYAGDRLLRAAPGFPETFVPRAPESAISAQVISIVNGITMAGQRAVVVINKGEKDDVQVGHVLALYRKGETARSDSEDRVRLPSTRFGLLLVFRTFENVSYALVMEAKLPVEIADTAKTP